MKKYFLLKYFTIYSLIAFSITGILLVLFLNNHMKNDQIDSTKKIIHSILYNTVYPEIQSNDLISPLSIPTQELLNQKIEHAAAENNIIDIRLRNENGIIIYSYKNPDITNITYIDKYIDQPFLRGPDYIILNSENFKSKIIKIYLPISHDNKIVGRYEVFTPYDEIELHIRKVSGVTSFIVFAGLIILYIFLVKVMYNSSKKLLEQNETLIKNSNELKDAYLKLNLSYKNTVLALSNAVDARDPYTAGHSERVTKISVELGKSFGLSSQQLETLELAALFHDVGKIGIPDSILNKSGKLTDVEFNKIKEHPSIGVNILKSIGFLDKALPIILHHHEKFNGGGYPNGIQHDEIPLEARILTVADSYDAMTSDRPYRKGLPHNIAISELKKFENIQFDEKVVDVFLKIEEKF